MTKDELVKLAERCEAASGADRELDREIAVAVGHPWDYAADWGSRGHERPVAFPYTASIDAAMTLIKDCDVLITLSEIKGDGMPYCVIGNPCTAETFSAVADTMPLAICASALRARATTTGEAK